MRKIRQYVVKGQAVYVGLEDSKRSWKVCVRSEGVVVDEASMEARYEVLRAYLRRRFPQCRIRVLYEAGFRGFGLHDQLVADGWECVVTPPHTVTEAKCQRQKNDRTDCRRLAANNERGDYRVCAVPSRQWREDRQVVRLLEQITKDITRVCSRIRRALEFHGLDGDFPAGQWTRRMYREVEAAVQGMSISESLRGVFEELFSQLRELRGRYQRVVKRLRAIARLPQYREGVRLLSSAPGVGRLTAIRLVLEWGDVRRFGRKEEFASFLGLIPSDHSTGERDRKGHITRQGNRRVRRWLVESAWVAIGRDPVLLEKFRAVRGVLGRGKDGRKRAIVAVARKLAIRLRALLLSGQRYQLGLVS